MPGSQLYTTEFIGDGSRFRMYGNGGGGGSLYLFSDGVWTRMQNYYSDSMNDLAAWDRVTVGKRIGKP